MNSVKIKRRATLLKVLLCFIYFSLFSSVYLNAQIYNYEIYEAKDGLAQNSVNDIIQTQDGYLWLSTEGGLSRFDGVSFTNFNTENTGVFKSNRMGFLLKGINGDLLTYNYLTGMMRYKDNNFSLIDTPISQSKNRLQRFIKASKDKYIMLDSDYGISIYDDNYQPVTSGIEAFYDMPLAIIPMGDYFVWVYTCELQLRDNALKRVEAYPVIEAKESFSSPFYNEIDSSLWMLDGNRLCNFKGFQLINSFPIKGDVPNGKDVYLLAGGKQIFAYTLKPLMVYTLNIKDKSLQLNADLSSVCPDGYINKIFIDKEQNVWAATTSCGLVKVKPFRFSYLDKDNWEISRNFYSIIRDNENNFLLGRQLGGILKIDVNGNKLESKEFEFLRGENINALENHKGDIYISYSKVNYILKWDGTSMKKIFFPYSGWVLSKAIYSAPDSNLYVGSEKGVFQLKGELWVKHPVSDSINNGTVSSFLLDKQGRLWIASSNHLIAYDTKIKSIVFDSRIELKEGSQYRAIYEDADGRIFVGSYGNGITIIENDSAYTITNKEGLVDNVVSSFTEDGYGHIWTTGNKGLSQFSKNELFQVAHGEKDRLQSVLYNGSTDRLRSSEFNGGVQHSKLRIDDDKYVFPSLKGAVIIDLSKLNGAKKAAVTIIEKIAYNDSTYFSDKALKLYYSADRIEFFYTALSFIAPKEITFKYKLEGFDDEWIEAGRERKVSYSKIPPGDYVFKVKAKNHEGEWSTDSTQFVFSILPPFYLTAFFRFTMLAILILITILIVNAINKRKQRKLNSIQQKQLEAVVSTEEKERKRIAADLHDGVGQLLSSVKINLGVSQEKIKGSTLEERVQLLDETKGTISQIMSEIRNISYNLMPPSLAHFGLGVAIGEEASRINSDSGIKIHFDNSTNKEKFDQKTEIILFRVFQELLNNTLKHSEANEITIQLIEHDDSLMLMMDDNGKGFDFKTAIRKKNSSGLKNMQARIALLNGKLNIDSKEGYGTNCIIEVPLQ